MKTDLLYIGTNGYVVALDPDDGDEVWRTKLDPGLVSHTRAEDVCVLVHEGRVFAGCNGHLFCLDAATGKRRWRNNLRGLGHNDVTLAIAGAAIQYVATHTRAAEDDDG